MIEPESPNEEARICAIIRGMSEVRDPPKGGEHRPRPIVKIYGERNTGTTYVERLLCRNLDLECLPGSLPRRLQRLFPRSEYARDAYFRLSASRNLGWKHAAAPTREMLARSRHERERVLFLTLSKNPYAWLLSLYRRPYHAAHRTERLADFLSEAWQTVGRENAPRAYPNPIVMWNEKNRSYLALADDAPARHVRYEDLLRDPIAFLVELAREFGFRPREPVFRNIDEATKREDRGRRFDEYREDYTQERWRADLDSESIRRINVHLDADLMSRLGYAFVEA